MTKTDSIERSCMGDPFSYAMKGIEEIPGSTKQGYNTLAGAINERYGTDISTETGSVLKQINDAKDAQALVDSVKAAGLDEVEAWRSRFADGVLEETVDDVENPGLGEAMRVLDQNITNGLCQREESVESSTKKNGRDSIYVPELINKAEDGTIYMAKTISSSAKVRMAWDLNDSNQVVVVNDYDKWEKLLGWEKLKTLPHGKNKIREELGDQLSDDVLERVAGNRSKTDTETRDTSSSSSRGRRTRTKPSEETLNLAISSSHKKRAKHQSKDIAEAFDDGECVSIGYGYETDMLVLFPTTTDLNMTDHWWVPGSKPFGEGSVAIANCNKGTFEYLNQYDQVWHIEDYLAQAWDHEFKTSAGPLTMNVASTNSLVVHVVSSETQERYLQDKIIENIPEVFVRYVNEEMFSRRAPEVPHPDDIVYAPITEEDAFWMRPALRKQNSPIDGDAVVCRADVPTRDLGTTSNVSSDYWLYSRARLPEWDFDSIEMSNLDSASHYFDLDDGGYEMVETLGKLHDAGKRPFSQTPESRWS